MRYLRLFPQLLLLCLLAACSRTATPVEALIPLESEVPGWAAAEGEVKTFDSENLWKHINGAAEKYTKRGFKRLASSKFRHDGGLEALADIYDMGSAAAAKEIFELSSPVDDQRIDLGDDAQLAGTSLEFYKGAYFVRIVALGKDEAAGAALTVLGRTFLGRIEGGGTPAKKEAP